MSDEGQTSIDRLQVIVTALLEKQLLESISEVESAIAVFRAGEIGVFDTHAELLRHAAKAELMADRMARIGLDNASTLLRDAYDAGVIDEEEFMEFVGKAPEDVEPSPPLAEREKRYELPDKRTFVESLLAQGPVLLHIDARHSLAQVPIQFADDPKLVLRFGYSLNPPIEDLQLDAHGLFGTLTFGGVPFRCALPWSSIFSVVSEVDQRGMVWPDCVPDSVVESLQAEPEEETSKPEASPSKPRGSHLTLVK